MKELLEKFEFMRLEIQDANELRTKRKAISSGGLSFCYSTIMLVGEQPDKVE